MGRGPQGQWRLVKFLSGGAENYFEGGKLRAGPFQGGFGVPPAKILKKSGQTVHFKAHLGNPEVYKTITNVQI